MSLPGHAVPFAVAALPARCARCAATFVSHLPVICQSPSSQWFNAAAHRARFNAVFNAVSVYVFVFPFSWFQSTWSLLCPCLVLCVTLPFSWLPPVPPALPIFVILPLDVTLDQWHHYPLRSVHFYLTPKLHTSPASSPYSSPFDHRHLLIRNPNCLPFTSRCCHLILPAHLPLYSMCHLTDATFICLQLCVSDYVLVAQGCNNGFDVSQRGWRAPGLAYFASPLLIHPALHGLYPSYPPSTAVV